jgi:hypothetical protein
MENFVRLKKGDKDMFTSLNISKDSFEVDKHINLNAYHQEINESLKYKYLNLAERGLKYSHRLQNMYEDTIDKIVIDKYLPVINIDNGIIKRFLYEYFSYEDFLLRLAKQSEEVCLKYVILPNGIDYLINKDKPVSKQTCFLKYDPTRYDRYLVYLLKVLHINPFEYQKEYERIHNVEFKKDFPNFPSLTVADNKIDLISFIEIQKENEDKAFIIYGKVKLEDYIQPIIRCIEDYDTVTFTGGTHCLFYNQKTGSASPLCQLKRSLSVIINKTKIDIPEENSLEYVSFLNYSKKYYDQDMGSLYRVSDHYTYE